MSSTTMKLPFKRFVAQVSTGEPRPKSSYIALMAENLEALKACPWREAADIPAALVDHDFRKASHFSDAYDAFKMTGAWDAKAQKEVAFAGMAAYRFAIPAAAAAVAISSVTLPISRDRFLKGGVHVAAALSGDETPSTNWSVVTGQGASAYLANDAANVVESRPADGALTITSADLASLSATGMAYLWIYVTLEDYTDWWDQYSATEARQYAIEGSGMLVGDAAEVTFAGAVTPDEGPAVLLDGGSSPTWIQPLPTVNVSASAPAVPDVEPLVESFFSTRRERADAMEGQIARSFSTPSWTGTATIHYLGRDITKVTLEYQSRTGGIASPSYTFQSMLVDGKRMYYRFSPDTTANGDGTTVYLGVQIGRITVGAQEGDASGTMSRFSFRIVAADTPYNTLQNNTEITAVGSFYSSDPTYIKQTTNKTYYHLLLKLSDGVPSEADTCLTASDDGRERSVFSIDGESSPWTVTIAGTAYTVTKSDQTVTMKRGSELIGAWTSAYTGQPSFFDASVALRLPGETANAAVRNYGLAAAVGDFSHAVATFEAGTQPPDGELLGRLARMSRAATGEILYLHPESGALADELDVLRPVPRFFRTDSAPPEQTACQPGLSVWYRRPAASAAAVGFAYRDATVAVTKVTSPAFLQLALLALRAPSAFASRIVLGNAGQAAVHNGFVLRFVAWRCPAEQWDGSNGFAMAAMASMPSVYRSDGPSEVSWSVDCTGALLRFGVRNMTAERVGVSQTVTGDIAANTQIAIPLVAPVGAGDVVLIAPEVLGFADGTGAASVHFGRQDDPSQGTPGWARYEHNLGWFPRVTGE